MTHLLGGNQVQLLRSGAEYFPALIAAIEASSTSVWLETYLYSDDETGERVTAALVAAAARGVQVRVTVDGFGAAGFSQRFREGFEAAGVEFAIFRPEAGRWWPSRQRLRRMHRKLTLVDERIGFVTGINIQDDLIDLNHGRLDAPRFDFAVQVEGAIVGQMAMAMTAQWLRVGWRQTIGEPLHARHLLADARRAWRYAEGATSARAAFVVRDNLRHRLSIERAYLAAIGQAHRDITISNAYFLPGRRFSKALRHAVTRGVRVRLLLQGRTEYLMQRYATQALYNDLLAAGIEIHEYQRSFLHAKVAVIDDDWATVGSSNIDPFSLLLAREANVVVRDRTFAGQLRESLDAAIQTDALRIVLTRHVRRPWPLRALSMVAYGLLRLAVLLAGQNAKY